MRSILALICLSLLSSRALAGDLDFGPIQCREGLVDSGPVLTQLSFDRAAKPFVCQFTATNNTGATLNGVNVNLKFGTHPDVALVKNADLDADASLDVDAGAYYHCLGASGGAPMSATFEPGIVIGVAASHPGFNQNVVVQGPGSNYPYHVSSRCFDFTHSPRVDWTINNLGNAQQSTMRVTFYSGYSVQNTPPFTTHMSVVVTGATATLPAKLPIVVDDTEADDFAISAIELQRMTPTLALAGTLQVSGDGGTDGVANARTGTELDLYLPYLRYDGGDWELEMDGEFDPAVDLLLFDPNDLQLNVSYRDYNAAIAVHFRDLATSAQEVSPTSAFPIPLKKITDNHYHLDWGYFPGDPGNLGVRRIVVSWAVDFSIDDTVQSWLARRPYATSGAGTGAFSGFETGRVCVASDQTPEKCRVATGTLYDTLVRLKAALASDTLWEVTNGLGSSESYALAPFDTWISALNVATLPWRGLSLSGAIQLPNGHATQDVASAAVYVTPKSLERPTMTLPTTMTFSAGTTADTSNEGALLTRVVPISATSTTIAPGTLSADTKEIAWTCVPSRHGVRNFGRRECGLTTRWTIPKTARSSITGEALYSPHDMTDASLGATAKYAAFKGDTQQLSEALALDIEVDARSRYSTTFVTDGGLDIGSLANVGFVHQSAQTETTIGAYASVGCLWGNTALGNIYGPVTIVLTWPEGYFPASTNPDDPDGARALFGRDTFGFAASAAYGARAPTSAYDYDVDLPSRTLTVTFDGPLDGAAQRFPGADEVDTGALDYEEARWLAVRLRGTYLPGVAPVPAWGCTVTVGAITSSAGALVTPPAIVSNPGTPHRVIGPSSLTLDGASSANPVTLGNTWTTTLNVRNAAYTTTGVIPDGGGASVQSDDTVIYVRVPRAGDPGQLGTVATAFVSAALHASNPAKIYVSTLDSLPSPLPNSDQLAGHAAFTRCADEGQTCLAGAVVGDVRWVAFALDTVLVTDAAPRGTPPPPYGAMRIEAPYIATLTLADIGSSDGARAVAYAVGTNATGAPIEASFAVDLVAPDLCAVPLYDICVEDEPGSVFTFDVVRAADDVVCTVQCTISGPAGALTCATTPVCP